MRTRSGSENWDTIGGSGHGVENKREKSKEQDSK